ncbi:unnamed protein product [Trichobilharzia szidati]|nr:unnamed protein product [Trichobilharzia szidati]
MSGHGRKPVKLPSFVSSHEELEKMFASCPFMSVLLSQPNMKDKKSVKQVKKESKDEEIAEQPNDKDTTVVECNDSSTGKEISAKSDETTEEVKETKDTRNDDNPLNEEVNKQQNELSIEQCSVKIVQDNVNNNNNNSTESVDAYKNNKYETLNCLNSLCSIKKLQLNEQFKTLTIDEQNEENEIRQKQLNKLFCLIQSNPGRYGELSIQDIHEQMSHFYL